MLAVYQQPPQDIGIPALKSCISLTDEGLHRSYCQRAAEVEECANYRLWTMWLLHKIETPWCWFPCDLVDDDCLRRFLVGKLWTHWNIWTWPACARIPDVGIRVVAKTFHQLKHLNLGQCHELEPLIHQR